MGLRVDLLHIHRRAALSNLTALTKKVGQPTYNVFRNERFWDVDSAAVTVTNKDVSIRIFGKRRKAY